MRSNLCAVSSEQRRHHRGLELIAVFKAVKAILLIAAGIGAFRLLNPVLAEQLRMWLEHFSMSTGHRLVEKAIVLIAPDNQGKVKAIGVGAVAYGSLFAVEGVGLWLEKRWAEYLTVVATGLLIPLEAYELAKQITVLRAIALLANTAVVIYLIMQLRKRST